MATTYAFDLEAILSTIRKKNETSHGRETCAGNPLYEAPHREAMFSVWPIIEEVVGSKYLLTNDFEVIYDPIEDPKLGKKPLIGGPFRIPYLNVINRENGACLARIEFQPVGEVHVISFDESFDELEHLLEQRLRQLKPMDYVWSHTGWHDTFTIGYLHFSNTEDERRNVFPITQSRNSSPIIVADGSLRPIVNDRYVFLLSYTSLQEPNKIRFERPLLTPEVVPYRRGRYIIQKKSDDQPQANFELEIPEHFSLGHGDLYYCEPLSVEWLRRLASFELSAFGSKTEFGGRERHLDCSRLTEEDLTFLAERMLGWPYSARGKFFSRLNRGSREKPVVIARKVLEEMLRESSSHT